MSYRLGSILLVASLLVLSVVGGGRTQEQPLVPPELLQKATQRGSVRVIVQLHAPYVPEARLPSRTHVAAQRRDIAATQGMVRGTLRGFPHRAVRDFRAALPMMAIEVGPEGLRMLESMRGVVSRVVEDVPRRPALVESVPRIQATQAQSLGYDGTGAAIVIMDTGVEKAHPFFDNGSGGTRVVAEACFSSNEGSTATTLCPDGEEEELGPGTGEPCDSTIDFCGHGTSVAGIAAGRSAGFNGVAPGADIVSIQIFSRFLDDGFCGAGQSPCLGSFATDEIAAAIYVKDVLLAQPTPLNIAAINLSLGAGTFTIPCDNLLGFEEEAQIINELRAAGVAVVAASGNEFRNGSVTAPGCFGGAVSVGATTDPPSEAIASFSNRAPGMSLLAPGVSINTSAVGGGFESVSGTSMAAPHVAGIFALFRQAVPSATVDQIEAALQATGQSIGGFKRVKVYDALATFSGAVPVIRFDSAVVSDVEGDSGTRAATVALVREGPATAIASGTSTVLFSTTTGGTATAGTTGIADYVAVTNQLVTFGPGETLKFVSVTLRSDFTIEPNESVKLKLASPTFAVLGGVGPGTATLTILNDDVPGTMAFDQAAYTVNEGAGPATITIRRTGGLGAGATAKVSTIATGSTATAGADYTAVTNRVVTFVAGADTATFTVPIVNDTIAEAAETIQMRITAVGAGATVGALDDATLTVTDNDVAGSVQFSQATYEVTEGTSTSTITVNRTGGAASGATIQYRVAQGNAGTAAGPPGGDYTLATGTLTFAANQTSRTFTVAIVNDKTIETDETVNLELFNESAGLTIGAQGTAQLTIHDNDGPTFRFGAATYTVAEGAPASVTVMRANGLDSQVTVDYAVQGGSTATGSGTDYTLPNDTLTFAPGVTKLVIPLPTTQDDLFEGSETVVLGLVNPSQPGSVIAPATTTVTITDNDTPGVIQFGAAAYSVPENPGGEFTVRILRTGTNLASNVTVDFATSNGTATAQDYTPVPVTTLSFAAGESFKDVSIAITPDTAAEGNETVILELSNPTPPAAAGGARPASLGARRAAVLTIVDDEQSLQFSAPVYVVNEATSTATVTVLRTGPTTGTATVDYATVDGSASAGLDYTHVSGTLTFAPGIKSRTFTVRTINDSLFEEPESIALVLSNPLPAFPEAQLGPTSTSTITIVNNDLPGAIRFSSAAYATSEAAASATITVQRTGGTAGPVTVDYTTADGSATVAEDYLATSGTLTFDAGQTSKTFIVPILNDTLDEPSETVNLTLSNPTGFATLGAQATAVLSITDNDVPGVLSFSLASYRISESAENVVVTVKRSGGAGGVTVDYTTVDGSATAGQDYQAVNGALSFGAGVTSQQVAIPILADTLREGDETIRVMLTNPTGGATLAASAQSQVTIVDDETGPTVQFGAAAYSVAENVASGQALITITRTGIRTPGETVQFSAAEGTATDGVDFAATNQVVTFTGTQASITVPVTILTNDEIVGDRTVILTLGSPSGQLALGAPNSVVLTIKDDDSRLQFADATISVSEGTAATLTVTRTGGTVGTATVLYTTANGSATAPSDFAAKAGKLTLGPGVASGKIVIATTNDVAVEGAETFSVTLSSPTGATLGAPSVATVTIDNNDAAGTLDLASPTLLVTEQGQAKLTVTRSGGSSGVVTVQYATSDGGGGGTAATGGAPTAAGTDYTAMAGTLTFANGVTTRIITVPTKADTAAEGLETFTVALSTPGGGATLGQDTTVVTIADPAGAVQFSQVGYAIVEGGTATITVSRSGGSTGPVAVDYATSDGSADGSDYTPASGTLTFAAGEMLKTFEVVTGTDVDVETESVTLTLTDPTNGLTLGATATATLWIVDAAQTVGFIAPSPAVIEGRTVSVAVTRGGVPDGTVTVDYALDGASSAAAGDFALTPAPGTVTFPPGVTMQTIRVQTVNDTDLEGPESIVLRLANPAGATLETPDPTQITLVDNERPDLAVETIDAPDQAAAGLPMRVTVTVRNRAGLSARASRLGIFVSPLSDEAGAGTQVGVVAIPPLPPLASVTRTASVTLPASFAAGDYFVSGVADVLDVVVEENESNGLTASDQVSVVLF